MLAVSFCHDDLVAREGGNWNKFARIFAFLR